MQPGALDLLAGRPLAPWQYNVGYALADQNLMVLTSSPVMNRWVEEETTQLVGRSLLELFPELIGQEAFLGQLAHDQADLFIIPKIYRPSADELGRYFDLQIEPLIHFDPSILLVIATDVTAQAHLELALRQERNELLLSINERMRVEAALRQAKEELEIAVAKRTAELQEANQRLRRELEERLRAEEMREYLEEQVHQLQKMQAIGRLAGGIAHDFNNLLTAIMGYTDLALKELLPTQPMHKDIQNIRKSAERAAMLTRQLLAFARKQIIAPEVLSLNDLIFNIDKLLRRLIGEDIELVILLEPEVGLVKIDPSQFEQVLVNLVVNARDAMPDGGKLIIETTKVTLDQNYARQHIEVTPGEYVALIISDNGRGMTHEVKAHLFEPFFTTKEVGKGTGLGLATCLGIVKQNGGHIGVYSELNHGTTFKIYLPRIEAVANPPTRREPVSDLLQGTETILLVEDEAMVRELAVHVLRQQGFTILAAANGGDALRLVQEQAGTEIHLLLTDVVMPQLGGKALADQLSAIYPKLKVLFMSGYTDDAIVHHGVLEPGIDFLQKPFSPSLLTHKVREVLDRANPT